MMVTMCGDAASEVKVWGEGRMDARPVVAIRALFVWGGPECSQFAGFGSRQTKQPAAEPACACGQSL
jgi:hypothetical protein